VCSGDAVIDSMMAEYFEYDWTQRHIGFSSVSPTKAESLNGIQDKTHLIQAIQNLIPTRPEIGEFQCGR
jgi:hypothetical protein